MRLCGSQRTCAYRQATRAAQHSAPLAVADERLARVAQSGAAVVSLFCPRFARRWSSSRPGLVEVVRHRARNPVHASRKEQCSNARRARSRSNPPLHSSRRFHAALSPLPDSSSTSSPLCQAPTMARVFAQARALIGVRRETVTRC
ncbi:hypothetical protein FA09DRAFT_192891 [Tilletiopsis washingtonensis]|uniref:Uncharacterized protein n=1 Tax=Tilletiopsis washingtonensis TaxID=58919 RepID=A0A316ZH68_9BASI|nr:hypothetical protein FA09DRAFT_192891 [Tilletiopsis washingtonensis]PWO00607.1 hypothetical protein FA09DRAFT_192891 [Tilletiopsis washingtonensis]